MKDVRLRDLPSFAWTTDPKDFMLEMASIVVTAAIRATAVIINTFDELDHTLLTHLAPHFHRLFDIGPLHCLVHNQEIRYVFVN